jgi:hypothetical protein
VSGAPTLYHIHDGTDPLPAFRQGRLRADFLEDYNNKFIEFARANTNAAFDFVEKMSSVKSPSVFVELWAEYVRKQVKTLVEQTKLATAEPLKTGVAEAFNHAA